MIKQYPPRNIQARISAAKNALQGPESFRAEASGNFYNEKIADVYDLYDKYMKQNNALDFDDLLFATTKLLADETIRRRWQDHLGAGVTVGMNPFNEYVTERSTGKNQR